MIKLSQKSRLTLRLALIVGVSVISNEAMGTYAIVELNVGAGLTATAQSGRITLPNLAYLDKTGEGTLMMTGSHSAHQLGIIRVSAGKLGFTAGDSLGAAAEFWGETTLLSNIGGGVTLSTALSFVNQTAANFYIDCNKKSDFNLPALNVNCNFRADQATLIFKNDTASSFINVGLNGAYTQSHNDIMVVPGFVNIITSSAANVAPNLTMKNGSKISISGGDVELPNILIA